MPEGIKINKLRIDVAGYQAKIIEYYFDNNIEFAIRAKMCKFFKDIILDKDNKWQPLLDKQGNDVEAQTTFKMQHFIDVKDNKGKVFDLIVQITPSKDKARWI